MGEVKDQLEGILDSNYKLNLQYIEQLLQNNINISRVKDLITQKLSLLNSEYTNKKNHIGQIIKREQEIRDTLKTNRSNNLIIQLKDILTSKGDEIMKLLDIIKKRDNIIIIVDSILFDNIIMLDKIMKNFNIMDIMLTEEL